VTAQENYRPISLAWESALLKRVGQLSDRESHSGGSPTLPPESQSRRQGNRRTRLALYTTHRH